MELTNDKSTLIQILAWCRQATSHYLSQCWSNYLSPFGVTRAQWANSYFANFKVFIYVRQPWDRRKIGIIHVGGHLQAGYWPNSCSKSELMFSLSWLTVILPNWCLINAANHQVFAYGLEFSSVSLWIDVGQYYPNASSPYMSLATMKNMGK